MFFFIFPYAHTYPSESAFISGCQCRFQVCIFEVRHLSAYDLMKHTFLRSHRIPLLLLVNILSIAFSLNRRLEWTHTTFSPLSSCKRSVRHSFHENSRLPFFSRFTLILTPRPHIRFPSVKPDVCRQPPSDSALWRTSLALAVTFPPSWQFSDLHPLVHVHAGHLKKGARSQTPQINNYLCHSNFKIFLFALSMTCVSNEAK